MNIVPAQARAARVVTPIIVQQDQVQVSVLRPLLQIAVEHAVPPMHATVASLVSIIYTV
jgi:hypothetical protein